MTLKISVFGRVRDLKVTLKNHPDVSRLNLVSNILYFFPPTKDTQYLIEAPEISERLMFKASKVRGGFRVVEIDRSPVLTLDMG